MRHIKHIIILFTAIIALLPMRVAGQGNEPRDVTFSVKARQGKSSQPEIYPTQYVVVKTENRAREVMRKLMAAIEKDGYPDGENYNQALIDNRVRWKRAKANGTFIARVKDTQAVLVCVDDKLFGVFVIKAGHDNYDEVLDFKFGDGTLKNVDVKGTKRKKDVPPFTDVTDDGLYLYPRLTMKFDPSETGDKVRVMIQPVAIDCQTEDTVDYLQPIVYEGKSYNDVQHRRMAFDYVSNESGGIGKGYVASHPLRDGEVLEIDTTLVWRKKDIKRSYRFAFDVEAEDYTHQHKELRVESGTCDKKNYFKFLNLEGVTADLPRDEYAIEADETAVAVPRDLKLKFLVGKAELTNDSLNDVQLNMLIKEMKEYGELLSEVNINAYASPDGDAKKNEQLAKQRGSVAMNMVMRGLGHADVYKGLNTTVKTWADVADELEKRGEKGKADTVRTITDGNQKPDAALRALPFYQTHIDTILQDMRSMQCIYKYEQMKRMDADQVVEYYYENKQKLLNGDKEVRLSDGDYFNLLDNVTDSAELDTITVLAYRHMTSQPSWEKLKFSQYVVNRMAIKKIREGHPDAKMLEVYVDTASALVVERTKSMNRAAREYVQKNRREVCINYITALYQQEERGKTDTLLYQWFSDSTDPQVERLRNYVNFKKNFIRYYMFPEKLSEEQKESFKETEEYVLGSAPDNRAVLYTEARQLMGKSTESCEELINKMSDDNAKKWYLLGILKAEEEQLKGDVTVGDKYVPLYLALFYKSFTLDPNLRTVYFADGQISIDLRKKYKYRKRDIPRYEAKLAEYLSERGKDTDEDSDVLGEDEDDTPSEGSVTDTINQGVDDKE